MSEKNKEVTCYSGSYQLLYKSVLDCALYAHNHFTCDDKSKPESQYRKDLNFCILGGPGCGKSGYTKYYCKKSGIECHVQIVSQISAADASGIEIPKNKLDSNKIEVLFSDLPDDKKESIIKHFENKDFKLGNAELKNGKLIFNLDNDDTPELIFCPPAWMKTVHDRAWAEKKKGKPFILHLDEINTADRFIMKIFLGVILDKKMRDYEWPDNVIIIATGNYDFDINDPAFMTRFLVFASDKTPFAELPKCNIQDYELSRMVNNAFKISFNIGEDAVPLLDDKFEGTTIPESQLPKLRNLLLDIFEKARLDANSSNSSDLNITYEKGVSGILINFRNAELVLSGIVAAILTNNCNPIFMRCIFDNIGTYHYVDKVLYYSLYASKIKTIQVDPDGSISTMDIEQFERIYRDQINEYEMNPYSMEFFNSMINDFAKVLNFYGAKDDSELDNKIKGKIKSSFRTSIGAVLYSGEHNSLEDFLEPMKNLYTPEIKQKFDSILPLYERITGESKKDFLSR